jgi:lysophospholipase L1-like esterase
MKWFRCLLALCILLVSQVVSASVVHAASDYDDFFPAQSTTTLINDIDNYYGMSCGSTLDDYASIWSEAMHTNDVYSSDPAHGIAMASFDAAVAGDGGWWVQYDQVNNGDNTSNPYFITVFWADDASQWEQVFTTVDGEQRFILQRKAGVSTSVKLQYGFVGSSWLIQGGGDCNVEWLFGGANYTTNSTYIAKGSPSKLFLSTFDVVSPPGYEGAAPPSTYTPGVITGYNDLLKVTPTLSVFTDGSAKTQTMDISETWWRDFKQVYAHRVAQNIGWPANFVPEFEEIVASGGSWGLYTTETMDGTSINIVGTRDPNATCGFSGLPSSGSYQCKSHAGYGFVSAGYFTHNSYGGNGCGNYQNTCSDNGMHIYASPTVQSGTAGYTFLSIGNTSLVSYEFYFMNFDLSYPNGYGGDMIPTPNSAIPSNATYVALGDSFSSGEGNPAFEKGTYMDGVNECHRSPLAYPRLLQADTSLSLASTAFVACSGATTWNVLNGSWGGGAQTDAISASTDIVTLTIGGNDIKFSDFAAACVYPTTSCSTASDAYDESYYIMNNSSQSNYLPTKLAEVYQEIASKLTSANTDARVLVLGYPHVVTYNGFLSNRQLTPTSCPYLDGAEAAGIESLVDQLNSTIQTAVASLGDSRFEFVNPNEDSLSPSQYYSRELCGVTPYFNGVDVFDTGNKEYFFHPNASGQEDYKNLVKNALS